MKTTIVENLRMEPSIDSYRPSVSMELVLTADGDDVSELVDVCTALGNVKQISAIKRFLSDNVKAERIIQHGPATILFWNDGEKTIVKLQAGDRDDPEKAIMAAMLKRLYPNFQDKVRSALGIKRGDE